MVAALVGAFGTSSQPAAGSNVTPAWGAGASRAAGHLGVLYVMAEGTASAVSPPAAPSGWSQLCQYQQGFSIATIFVRTLTGGDAAPTVTGIANVNMAAALAEFSGVNTAAILDQTAGAGNVSNVTTVTNPASSLKSGELFLFLVAPLYSAAATETFIPTFNNGTPTTVANSATSTRFHYAWGYSITNANATPDQYTLNMTATNLQSAPGVIASVQVTSGIVNGSATVSLGGVTVTATGSRLTSGTASVALGGVTVTASGRRTANGTAAVSIGGVTVSAAGSIAVLGTASVALGAVTVTVSVKAPVVEVGGSVTVQTDTADATVQSDLASVGVQTDFATATVQED